MASNIPSTVIGATGNAHVENLTIVINPGTVDVIGELQKQTRESIELSIRDTVEPLALDVVLEKIRTGSACVTITGSPGDGKSTLGYLVLGKLQESRNVFDVSSPEQFAEVIKTNAPVILLDDIFGQTVFKETAWEQWKKPLQKFFSMQELNPTNTIGNLIVIAREYVLNSGSRNTEDPWEMLIDEENVVNISSSSREHEEKVNILNAICKRYKVHLDSKTIKTICSINTPHGFPHACKLFVTKYSRISAVEFFNKPLEFLRTSLKVVIQDKRIEPVFIEMIKGDGHVLKRELSECGFEYIITANDLCPIYLKPDREGYVFDHPSIFDTVALLFCETKLSFILAHCSMEFINERVWLKTPDGEEREKRAGAKLMTEIPWDEAGELARRFGKEIAAGKYDDVKYHNAWTSDMFVKLVIQSMSVEQLNVPAKFGYTLLHRLCEENRVDCAKVCGQRADINNQNGVGWTALHCAAMDGRTDVVSALLECGADVNFQDGIGLTALHWAAIKGSTELVIALVKCGADVNIQNRVGRTALHGAVMDGRTDLVSALLECGADVNIQDGVGWTALHWAAMNGSTELVSAVLECGADVNIQNGLGDTALDCATRGQSETVAVLRAAGGRTTRR